MIKSYKGIWPKVHPAAFIEDSAQIIGDVEIGEDSSIWFNTVLRGDVHYIRIGNRTNIQDGSVIHVTNALCPTIVEDEVTVGHGVILHGCVVKKRSLIGMGAIVMDNAIVGSDCIVAAGSVVSENSAIESGWLVMGIPAKPKRPLTEKEKAWILRSVNNYVEYKNVYVMEKKNNGEK